MPSEVLAAQNAAISLPDWVQLSPALGSRPPPHPTPLPDAHLWSELSLLCVQVAVPDPTMR